MATKIAVLSGGQSSEREVALRSADSVVNILKEKYEVKLFDIPQDMDKFLKEYKKFQVAIPVFHGSGGADGVIQGFLKTLGLPFIFSDIEAHAVGINKILTKKLAEEAGIVIPQHKVLTKQSKIKYIKPVVIKPYKGGSSIGIALAKNQTTLDKAITEAFKYDDKVLVEEYISGKEFTVAVIEENNKAIALPVIAIVSKNDFFDYDSKYNASLVDEICPADIDDKLAKELKLLGIKCHQLIGARHLSRSDFIVKDNKIYFLEINTIPGITLESLLPKAIKAGSKSFLDLLEDWIESSSK